MSASPAALSPAQLEILWHALGLDERHSSPWRNHYSTDSENPQLLAMVSAGWMSGPHQCGGAPLFVVTDEGRSVAIELRPKPPKVSRSRARYLQFLREDTGLRFGEWLKVEHKRRRDEVWP